MFAFKEDISLEIDKCFEIPGIENPNSISRADDKASVNFY